VNGALAPPSRILLCRVLDPLPFVQGIEGFPFHAARVEKQFRTSFRLDKAESAVSDELFDSALHVICFPPYLAPAGFWALGTSRIPL
jgi:hypothetical protein